MNPSAPARHFTREDLTKWLDEKTLAKAERYVQAVSQLHVSDSEASALVQGREKRPYTVRVMFQSGRRGGVQVSMHCTCAVGRLCKHCGAVLLAAIEQRGETVLRPSANVLAWVKDFRDQVGAPPRKGEPRQRESLYYVLSHSPTLGSVDVSIRKARPLADGSMPAGADSWNNIERALLNPPSFVTREDQAILRLLWLVRDREGYHLNMKLRGRNVEELFPRMLATGRCLFDEERCLALHAAVPRTGALRWQLGGDGLSRIEASVSGAAAACILPTEPPWYVLPEAGEAGPLDLGIEPHLAVSMLGAPPLRPVDAAIVARELATLRADLPLPDTKATAHLRTVSVKPRARLRLSSQRVDTTRRWRGYPMLYQEWMDFAQPVFDYAGLDVTLDDAREFRLMGSEMVRLQRDQVAEMAAMAALRVQGFEPVPAEYFHSWAAPQSKHLFGLGDEAAWSDWVRRIAPALGSAGWTLELDQSFRHHVLDVEDFETEVSEVGPDWFDVTMGFELEGETLPLAPLLADLLREQPRLTEAGVLDSLPDTHQWVCPLEDGRRVRIPLARVRAMLQTFIALFDGSEVLRVSRLDATGLDNLAQIASYEGLAAIHAARDRLAHLGGVQPVAAPAGLGVQLRPYQLEGLAWLQTLREMNLGGILADDMGLGKTAQTLAHLLVEKQAGRLDRPALVVLPTSLVFNWRREAAAIAPQLSVHVLHGPQRDFTAIPQHDVVLTTYPLIWRDAEELKQHEFHILILDEAQTVKNSASKAAAVVREIHARHRLCLTGTPMENHLGELWTQFDFLLPGFLGDSKDFQRRWRTPIEKAGDTARRELLARRVKPFVLRRRKDDVARELPPKTVMLRSVELAGGQRDLYETVRATMDDRVRKEVAEKGFKQSQIVILDALLKLRQVCCDPRLLSMKGAERIEEHAKLDLLLEMLSALVAEGRRILLFSQFTSMLDLIVPELEKTGMPFVMLTGQTRDRETVVERFQSGEVPLFLISLKAGGVGLNLTAADTVIHFDPWWNPAVEEQATDRAHRIGQRKPVFVYKLIIAGSIEERIVALQEKKAALAAAVLSGDAQGDLKFTEEDIANLFYPLPE